MKLRGTHPQMVRKIFFMGLTLLWMMVIFCMSHETASQSSGTSSVLSRFICEILFRGSYVGLSEREQLTMLDDVQHLVRKAAHLTEFAILGFLLMQTTFLYRSNVKRDTKKERKSWRYRLIAVVSGVVYAVSDEIHQMFIPGRSCQLTDVLIDSIGVILGVLVAIGIDRRLKVK